MTTSSMRLIRAVEIIGMPVVTIDGGEDVAEVKDVVYDGTSHQLVGFTLNKRGWFRGTLGQVLAAEQIVAIGADAVMVGSEADVAAPVAAPDEAALREHGRDVLGNSVITTDGSVKGTVSGVILSAGEQPAAVGYELTDDQGAVVLIPISSQLAVSGDNLVVPTELRSFDSADLAAFAAFLGDSSRDAAGDTTGTDQQGASDE